jgi:hypothetical protein
MSNIEQMIEAMTAPSQPAVEVVTMPRALAEQGLAAMEQIGASASNLLELRGLLAEQAIQLWAIHSVGPGEEYPCMSKEDAGQQAQKLRALGDQMKAERIARGESVEMWSDWVTNVIPSPWQPAEHFEIMAQEWMDDAENVREHATKLEAQRDVLLTDLQAAATTLRRYEELHRAKGTDESTAKAEVNAALASRFESTIAKTIA